MGILKAKKEAYLHANEEAFFKEPRTTAQPASQVCSDVRPVETFWGRRVKDLEADRQANRWQVMTFATLIRDLAKALRYIPGRKLVVLFSSGLAGEVVYSGNILESSKFQTPACFPVSAWTGSTKDKANVLVISR